MFSDKLSPRCHVKKIVALLFLAALATSAGLFFFLTKELPSNTTPPSETDSARLHDKRIIEKGFDLTSLSREHLLERAQVQWSKSDHQLAEREVLVDEGMTVLTGGYEEVPGQFIFSAITPRFAKSKHGTEIVVFDL
ncbi:MAG TPA: hypothetical protein VK956_14285, partial [Verrucomicrobium sp.]|nr:hypothetical protein [Verrucomicrobium sp.]